MKPSRASTSMYAWFLFNPFAFWLTKPELIRSIDIPISKSISRISLSISSMSDLLVRMPSLWSSPMGGHRPLWSFGTSWTIWSTLRTLPNHRERFLHLTLVSNTHSWLRELSFHVVMPSMPGYIFSSGPQKKGWNVADTARVYNSLMVDVLGYSKLKAMLNEFESH